MPSRTYTQMLLKLDACGKMPLSLPIAKKFVKVECGLYKHPELVEEVVKYRVKIIKFLRSNGYVGNMHWYHYSMIDYCAACKVLGYKCMLTMPFATAKDLFYKCMESW